MQNNALLIVDDERKMAVVLEAAFTEDGFDVEIAGGGEDALAKFRQNPVPLVITDLKMPDMSGIELLSKIKKLSPDTEVILMTAYATAQTAVEAMKRGAFDYVIKPFSLDELKTKANHVFEKKRLENKTRELEIELKQRGSLDNIIGHSGTIQNIYKMIQKVAPKDATVLILGESGTGKELVARAIHNLSPRKDAPFVAINCAAFPENLLESELFGYEKGAFTGADRRKLGHFETAGEGTIFLDEIGEVSPAMQVKLLRVLQSKQVMRLGGTESLAVKARVLTATNRNLDAMIKDGSFREDLYYRINVFPIVVPPLRKRAEDIPDLVSHFLEKYAEGAQIKNEALQRLQKYDWPGNVRELENVIERSLIMAGDEPISVGDLPSYLQNERDTPTLFDIPEEGIVLEDLEKKLIERAIEKAEGNKSKAAKLLGITRRKLYSMMERFGGFSE
ncbi:sigma-54-dependent Fis family transcriptional regulator [candidate division KSB1 bacterium]|nr:sigma-54-dependent Fis family transcriptional regulator [candidate division KSB1 bacterium]